MNNYANDRAQKARTDGGKQESASTYTTRLYILPRVVEADGQEAAYLVSMGNYISVRKSKKGIYYGSIRLLGDNELTRHGAAEWLTVFFNKSFDVSRWCDLESDSPSFRASFLGRMQMDKAGKVTVNAWRVW